MSTETIWTVVHPDGSLVPEDQRDGEFRYIPAICAPAYIVDAMLRGASAEATLYGTPLMPWKREIRTKHWLDLGGIAWSKRKLYTLKPIDGLTLTVPATNVEGYIETVDRCGASSVTKLRAVENLGDYEVWRLPVMVIELWLEQKHLTELRAQLVELLPEASAIATPTIIFSRMALSF